jgi:hypothetical protein
MRTLAMSRPARVPRNAIALDREYKSARYIHHRLLDFEDAHQRILDDVQEECAPGINRVARILATLRRRKRRGSRSTKWVPGCHPELMASLSKRVAELRKTRNADSRWRVALAWADSPGDDAQSRGKTRRKKGEGWTGFLMRDAEKRARGRDRMSRREQYRSELYAAHVGAEASQRSRIYWGTWNALVKSVDQARGDVMKLRRSGMPAEWRRPRWDDDSSLHADSGGFRILGQSGACWVIEMRLHTGWARFRAKVGGHSAWHEVPLDAKFKTCKLTRRRIANEYQYTVSIVVSGMPDERTRSVDFTPDPRGHGTKGRLELLDGQGVVGLDWGHREHGHPNHHLGIRAFTWVGDDGQRGEVLIPAECRELLDSIDAMKSRLDTTFTARGVASRNRHVYRSRLMRSGVRTQEEGRWLEWETKYEQRIARARKRIANLREQVYFTALRELRIRYRHFAIEDEPGEHHRKLDTEEQTRHRKRQNRDLVARYLFLTICERLGGVVVPVSARNTTRRCPKCGTLGENGPELLIACPKCGTVEDKDERASEEILLRGQAVLAEREAVQ